MEVAKNIFIIKLPLPFKPAHVNCYLIKGKNGWIVIDAGLNYPDSLKAWEKALTELSIKYSDIEGIYITHYHPDHYGASGWLQELTGAPVYLHRTESIFVDQMWKKGRANIPVVGELFKENGMPPSLIAEVLENMADIWGNVQPHPKLSLLTGEERLETAGREFEVINTPGHSDGHICFYCREEGILIAGDHLLPKASSCISLWPTSYPNPLELFFKSLETIGEFTVKLVLPAHGPIFKDSRGRVQELLAHHRERLQKVSDLIGPGATAYHICENLFGTDLNLSEIRFALTETLAHLAFLESRSEVHSRQENGIVIYRKPQSCSCSC